MTPHQIGIMLFYATPDPYTRGWNEALEAARVQFAHDFGGSVRDDVMRKIRALKRSAP